MRTLMLSPHPQQPNNPTAHHTHPQSFANTTLEIAELGPWQQRMTQCPAATCALAATRSNGQPVQAMKTEALGAEKGQWRTSFEGWSRV